MNKKNTTLIGNKFENEVFKYFQNEINENRFFAEKEYCKIFKKKGYFSKDRLKDIIFDIAIELYLPNQNKYSILIIIECKDYNHRVPVDDVEEFYQKIEQISGGNTKAIIVSSNAFQEGSFNFSKSKGIGLLRYRNQDDLTWILTRSPSNLVSYKYAETIKDSVYKNLRTDSYINNFFDCNSFFKNEYTNSFILFITNLIEYKLDEPLKKSLENIKTNFIGNQNLVKYIDNLEIKKLTNDVLLDINYQDGKVDLYALTNFLEKSHNLKTLYNQNLNQGILGTIDFKKNKICIDNKQCKTLARTRFTIAHELAHYFLGHSKYMLKENFYNENEYDLESPSGIGIKDIIQMEWQANQFASYLLLPEESFLKDFIQYVEKYQLRDKGFGFIYLDNQKCNHELFINISSPLMQKYKVSRSVIKLRLKKLGLLKESSSFKLYQ